MGESNKRQRTESMIKLATLKKESKLWYEEANSHLKSGNLEKSLFCYAKTKDSLDHLPQPDNNLFKGMADQNSKQKAERTLSTTRETELLHAYVRVNLDDDISEGGKLDKQMKQIIEQQHKDNGKHQQESESKHRQAPMSDETSRKLSRQFQEEGDKKKGKKKRKKPPRHEELYCDKDRAAAVNMGSRDIKQSLKIKRKQDQFRALQMDEAEPATFLALGNYGISRGDLDIAYNFLSKALELNPAEKNSLVARSKCYILLGQPEKALTDAETALQIDKTFIKAIYQKAEALYYLGDFEHSLMYFHRGLHIRPDHEGFKLGVHKAQKAIENAIGSIGKHKSSRCSTSRSTTSRDTTGSVQSKVSNTPQTMVRAKTAKPSRLLRELGTDKDYLDNLMQNPNIRCKFKENDETIEKCIQETVEYLNARQEFWRQQLPANLK